MINKLTRMYIQHRLKDNENNKPKSEDKSEDNSHCYLSKKDTKDSRRVFRS